MYNLYLFALFASILRITIGADWCYESQVSCETTCKGPKKWKEVAEDCGGKQQSPVNIQTKKRQFKSTLTPLVFTGYQESFASNITNNGHTVKVSLTGNAKINGGEFQQTYKAVELHFHWGNNEQGGSEHTIDGEQFPMEMHIVHINTDSSSVADAFIKGNGVAVLGILFKVGERSNEKYDSIINALENITQPGNSSQVETLNLDMLMPSDLSKYYRYQGSLTTPNCTEGVIWTVFENPVEISKEQLTTFYNLQFDDEIPMVDTFRPVQPLNDRQVFYSAGHTATVSSLLVISTILQASWLF